MPPLSAIDRSVRQPSPAKAGHDERVHRWPVRGAEGRWRLRPAVRPPRPQPRRCRRLRALRDGALHKGELRESGRRRSSSPRAPARRTSLRSSTTPIVRRPRLRTCPCPANRRAFFGSGGRRGRPRSGSECFSALQPLWSILNSTRVCLVPITPRKGVLHRTPLTGGSWR